MTDAVNRQLAPAIKSPFVLTERLSQADIDALAGTNSYGPSTSKQQSEHETAVGRNGGTVKVSFLRFPCVDIKGSVLTVERLGQLLNMS